MFPTFSFRCRCQTLRLTVPVMGVGKGISEIYAAAKQAFVPEDVEKVKEMSGLPVLVKGIQSPEDALTAIQAGADGIWVSNHGGRQLDGGPASIAVLPSIA